MAVAVVAPTGIAVVALAVVPVVHAVNIQSPSGLWWASAPAARRPRPSPKLSDAELLRALDSYEGYAKTQMTAHGFRAMASTLLNGSRKRHADAIERQLAHVESNDVGQAYLRGEHWDERVRMLQHWSDHLDRMTVRGRVLNGRSAPG